MNEMLRIAARHWLRINTLSTVYASIGLTTGAVAGLTALAFPGLNEWMAFGFGFFLPMGPVYLYASSKHCMTRKLTHIKQWYEKKLITKSQYEQLRRQIAEWYGDRVCPTRSEEASGEAKRVDAPSSAGVTALDQETVPAELQSENAAVED